MWSYEHSAETIATPEAIWPYFEDVAGWPTWNEGIEVIVLEGPFATGSTFLMTPPGEQTLRSQLIEVRAPEGFTDVTEFDGVQVTVHHRLHRLPTGTRITYQMEITGEQADTIGPEIGPAISGDFPQVIAALITLAEGEQHQSTTP
jgi:polyketide cyclase/dehydrase/lipid transport protein